MTCPTHRAGYLALKATARSDRPEPPALTDADALNAVSRVLADGSTRPIWLDGRLHAAVEIQHHPLDTFGDGLQVEVFDCAEPDGAPGALFALTLTRLNRCADCDGPVPSTARRCSICIHAITEGDE